MQLHADNTNDLTPQVMRLFPRLAIPKDSRNGPVLRIPGVSTITLHRPWERVHFCSIRDANPFFHLIESMAMLAGDAGNSVMLLSYFAANMTNFSDDGKRYNAFYGTRLRESWGDQLADVVSILRQDPDSRQAVANIWDPGDLLVSTKDKACNLMLLFEQDPVWDDRINMTSFNRSNDAVWGGVCGANVVHLPFFHEWVAVHLQKRMGTWTHVSNNLHGYVDNPKFGALVKYYNDTSRPVRTYPGWRSIRSVGEDLDRMDKDIALFVDDLARVISLGNGEDLDPSNYRTEFIHSTVVPMAQAYLLWKDGDRSAAMTVVRDVLAPDWRDAGLAWMERRMK